MWGYSCVVASIKRLESKIVQIYYKNKEWIEYVSQLKIYTFFICFESSKREYHQ